MSIITLGIKLAAMRSLEEQSLVKLKDIMTSQYLLQVPIPILQKQTSLQSSFIHLFIQQHLLPALQAVIKDRAPIILLKEDPRLNESKSLVI